MIGQTHKRKMMQQTHEQKVDAKTHKQTMANMITITCSHCGLDLRGCVCVRERERRNINE